MYASAWIYLFIDMRMVHMGSVGILFSFFGASLRPRSFPLVMMVPSSSPLIARGGYDNVVIARGNQPALLTARRSKYVFYFRNLARPKPNRHAIVPYED